MFPNEKLRIFFESFALKHYPKGAFLISADEKPEGMFYLLDGYVVQYAKNATRDILFLHIYRPGSCLPLMWLFNSASNRYYYEALTDVDVKMAPTSDVKEFTGLHPDVIEYFTSKLLMGMDGLLSRMESLVFDTAYAKTVLLFWYFAKAFGKPDGNSIIIDMPIRHHHVASWIGTARETASMQMEELKRKKIIGYENNRYRIRDLTALDREVDNVKSLS